jgi:3-isopropylmalate/(R)-2-methylmalate dehydratase large subunit
MRIRVDGAVARGHHGQRPGADDHRPHRRAGRARLRIEFCGSAIEALSVEARFTLCNMAVEAGARGALIAPDQAAIDYVLRARPTSAPTSANSALAHWATLRSDEDARFDVEHRFDAAEVAPYVTWGTSPDQAVAIDGVVPARRRRVPARQHRAGAALHRAGSGRAARGLAVQHVFIGSCTNGRIEDLRAVARVVQGRHVAPGVRAMVVPGSGAVRAQAEAEGIAALAGARRLRMAPARLLDVPGDERRRAGARRALRLHHQPQFRGPPGPRRHHPPDEPRHGRGRRGHGRITDVRKLESCNDPLTTPMTTPIASTGLPPRCRHRQPRHRPDHAQAVPARHRQERPGEGPAVRPALRRRGQPARTSC